MTCGAFDFCKGKLLRGKISNPVVFYLLGMSFPSLYFPTEGLRLPLVHLANCLVIRLKEWQGNSGLFSLLRFTKGLRLVCSFVCLNWRHDRKDDAKFRQAVENNNSDFCTISLWSDFNRWAETTIFQWLISAELHLIPLKNVTLFLDIVNWFLFSELIGGTSEFLRPFFYF